MLTIHIAEVNGVLWSGEADALVAPAMEGEVTVLKGHVPLVTNLKPGQLVVRDREGTPLFSREVDRGILEVTGTTATVLL